MATSGKACSQADSDDACPASVPLTAITMAPHTASTVKAWIEGPMQRAR
jgi:hypothetical protein